MLDIVAEELGGRNERGWRSLREMMEIKCHNINRFDTASGIAFYILGSTSRLTSFELEDKTLKICSIGKGQRGY